MCALLKDLKSFQAGGLAYDPAVEYRAKNDYFPAYNIRPHGTAGLDEGYITNIESNQLLSASLPPGINRIIGSAGFESARLGVAFLYNSSGSNQLRSINYDTNELTITDISAWPLDPQHYVNDIKLINNEFLCFNDNFNPPGYVNYPRLISGGYGTLSQNDFMLIKQQPPYAPSASYGNDQSRSVNLLAGNEFQFRTAYLGLDFEQSIDSTISERFVPPFENTPGTGQDVTENNNLTVAVDAGDDRTSGIILEGRFANLDWFEILRISRAEILALPTTLDIGTQQYKAYDPVTNTFYFVYYNDGLYVNIPVLQTDQEYSNVPLLAGAMEVLNGNQLILGDVTTGYDRPTTPVQLATSNYNPNIQLSPSASNNPFEYIVINPGQSGSGEGDHKRLVVLEFGGDIQENDYVTINLVDIRNSGNVLSYRFAPCTSGDAHNTAAYISANATSIPNTSTYIPTDGQDIGLNIITQPFFTLQSVLITLFNAGSGIFRSIPALKGNSSYQVALAHYDFWGRPFPIQTDDSYILKTDSYGQSHGNTPQINWQLLSANAPAGAYTYQWCLSPNSSHQSWLFMLASIIQVAGGGTGVYDAKANTFTPSSSGAPAGTAWMVDNAGTQNLGNGATAFNLGDWVVAQGNGAFGLIPATYGDLSDSTNYYFYFNALDNYNTKYSSSILTYQYTPNDRCTIYNYQSAPGVITGWFDGATNPIIDVQVQGYDASVFFLKVNRSANIDPSVLLGSNVLLEVYTPKKRITETDGIATNNPTVFFETGQVYRIVRGVYQTLRGTITTGDNYFKTRELGGSVDPNVLYSLVVEDPNYSDFYISNYYSFGRSRTYSDVLGQTRNIANLIYSQTYIFGSQNNGLTTFYVADVYGNSGGQTSSSYGAVRLLAQINNELFVGQELNHATVPVYINIIEDQAEQQNVAISESILGNIRYTNSIHIGIGKGRESVAIYNNLIYFIDSNRSEPIRWDFANGARPINEKMSKYFRQVLAQAYGANLKVIGWYDIFNDEYVFSIQQDAGAQSIPFNALNWNVLIPGTTTPGQISITSSPAHSSASYNNITGFAHVVPASGYVGTDSFQITSNLSPSTRNVCMQWAPGSGTVNAFSFMALTGVPLSTEQQSNTIGVSGNDFAVPISVTGGQYSVNGGAFVSTPGTVNNGDIVQVQVLSSASNTTTTSCTLTIDSQSATFSVTTASAGNFTAFAGNYGMTIDSVLDGAGGSGVPAGYNPCNLAPGQSKTAAYTTLAAGQYIMVLDGSPLVPGHTFAAMSIGGSIVEQHAVTGAGEIFFTLGSPASDPTPVLFEIITES